MATTIVSFLLAFVGPISPAYAAYDLAVRGFTRSYPLSGVVEAELGEDALLWGAAGPGAVAYGFARASVFADTSLAYNAGDAVVEVFPISFMGLRAGAESVQNDSNYSAYDCITYVCRGRFYRTYFEAELSLGWGPWFAQARWRRERWGEGVTGSTTSDFVDPTEGLALLPSGDGETVDHILTGWKFGDHYSLMAALVYAQSDAVRGHISRFPLGLVRYHSGPFSVTAGAGVFSSPLKAEDFSAVLSLVWEITPSLALH